MSQLKHTDERLLQQMELTNLTFVCGTQHNNEGNESEFDDVLVMEPRIQTKRPPFYKVVMLNDDYTPMDFVVQMLKDIFRHSHEDAVNITLQIHNDGAGVCGVFTRDVAETKIDIVLSQAKRQEFPLQCVMEKEK